MRFTVGETLGNSLPKMEAKQQLAASICDFLQDSIKENAIQKDSKEGIEVAIQCIQAAFKVENIKSEKLMPIFKVYLDTKKQSNMANLNLNDKVSAEDKATADGLKSEGNKALAAKNFQLAIEKYTSAINLYASAVYYANRAAAYSQNGQHENARDDSKKALEIDPNYSKAYSRLGHAEFCLGNYKDSVEAYKKGLEMEPNNNSIKQSLAAAEAKVGELATTSRSAPAPAAGGFPGMGAGGMPDFSSMMSDPNFMNMGKFLPNCSPIHDVQPSYISNDE